MESYELTSARKGLRHATGGGQHREGSGPREEQTFESLNTKLVLA